MRQSEFPRDQTPTPFAAILSTLCRRLAAPAAAFVDAEGETVDFAGYRNAYDVRVMAAELGLLLSQCALAQALSDGSSSEVVIRAARATFAAYAAGEGYSLVVELPRRAFLVSRRVVAAALGALCREAGLPLPEAYRRERWEFAEVRASREHRQRPSTLRSRDTWLTLDVIGRYKGVDLHPREHAFRVRTEHGLELTLVRERMGHWYADHPVDPSSDPRASRSG